LCEFTNTTAITIIEHDHKQFGMSSTPLQNDGCAEPGCYTDIFTYNASMPQILSLLDVSSYCEQTIVNNCTNNPLTNTSWWVDRNNETHEYWHGSYDDNTAGCFCSLEGDGCSHEHFDGKCSCDDLMSDFTVDKGTLTNMKQLPVHELHYGDNLSRYSWILYDLGHLKCSGKSFDAMYPSEKDTYDYYFKFYMSTGWIWADSTPTLLFPIESIDKSKGAYKNGIFTAPVSGRYEFDLHLSTQYHQGGKYYHYYEIDFQIDDITVEKLHSNRGSTEHTAANMKFESDSNYYRTVLLLKKGQTLKLNPTSTNVSNNCHVMTESGCVSNGTSCGCSFIQGRLIEKL